MLVHELGHRSGRLFAERLQIGEGGGGEIVDESRRYKGEEGTIRTMKSEIREHSISVKKSKMAKRESNPRDKTGKEL